MTFWTDWEAPVVQWLRSPPPTRRTRIRFPAGVEVFIFWTPAIVEIPKCKVLCSMDKDEWGRW